jgi:hypothetical protein
MINHNYYLNTLKKLLGASFVGWVTEKETKYLKVTIKGKSFQIPFDGGDIGHESYTNLINSFLTLEKDNGGKEIQESVRLDETDGGAS